MFIMLFYQKQVSVLMVASPGRDLDNLPLLDHLPGGGHQVDAAPNALLDLKELLELLDPLHRVIGVRCSLGDLQKCA